jgi:hypothetical protein
MPTKSTQFRFVARFFRGWLCSCHTLLYTVGCLATGARSCQDKSDFQVAGAVSG